MKPLQTLRAYPHIEAYLADGVMVVAWFLLFLCIGRVSCAPQKAALAGAMPSKDNGAETPLPAASASPVSTAAPASTTGPSPVATVSPTPTAATGETAPPSPSVTVSPASTAVPGGPPPAATARPICFGFNVPGIVSTDTLIWLLASFFPGTALLYSIFNVVTRLYEIEESAKITGTYSLYVDAPTNVPPANPPQAGAPPGHGAPINPPAQDGLNEFRTYVRARFREYYNPWELVVFALGAGALVVVLAKLVVAKKYGAYLGEPLDSSKLPVAFTAGAGLAGAVAGAFVFVLKRYRTFNIYPSTYLHILAVITVGTFAGTLWHFVLTENLAIFLAFAIAFLAALNLEYFVDLLTKLVAKATGQPAPERPPSDLATVIQNPDAIEVLASMSLFSVAEFTRTDPMRLYLNLPQAIGTIEGWIDAELLRHFFASQLDVFGAAGVRQFSQLLNRLAVIAGAPATLQWRQLAQVTAIDNVNMARVLETVKDVVDSGRFDRQLGVISDFYLTWWMAQHAG